MVDSEPTNQFEDSEIYESPPEEIIESVVNVSTLNNSDGTHKQTTTKRTKKTVVTTVRKICVTSSSGLVLDSNNQTPNDSMSINSKNDDNSGCIINTIRSEGPEGTLATFAYLPPTKRVTELSFEENSESGETKRRTLTTTTSMSATALLNTRSRFKAESSITPDRLLVFKNSDQGLFEDKSFDNDEEIDYETSEDVKDYTLPDGSRVVKKRSKINTIDGGIAEKEHISVIPSSDDKCDGKVLSAEKHREKVLRDNSTKTSTTTTTVTKRILSTPIPKVFKNYFHMTDSKNSQNQSLISPFDTFSDFWDLDIGDDDMARKQIMESEKHFREQFQQLQQSYLTNNGKDAGNGSVVVKQILKDGSEIEFGESSTMFQSFFSGMPLYQSYGLLGQKKKSHDNENQSASLVGDFENNSSIFDYLEDLTSKAFRDSYQPSDSEDLHTPIKELEITNGAPFGEIDNDERARLSREQNIDDPNLTKISEQLANKTGPCRVAWSEMPEVTQSDFVKELTKQEIQLQEAMFEVITSEASYYHSLTILVEHFYNAPQFNVDSEANLDEEKSKTPSDILIDNEVLTGDKRVIKPIEKRHLFSNLLSVCLASRTFLQDLESRWIRSRPYLPEICDLIVKHASSQNFQPYIIYLRNQNYQIKTLKKLMQRDSFRNFLNKLHNDPRTGKNHLDSFLALPMQRLTRLKMLVEVIQKLQKKVIDSNALAIESGQKPLRNVVLPEHVSNSEKALTALKTLLSGCENEKKLMDQKSRILDLSKATIFPDNVKAIAFGSKFIVREGELKSRSEGKQSMLKIWPPKNTKSYYLILFHDLLLITKSKGGKETKYIVLDYCEKNEIEARIDETNPKSTPSLTSIDDQDLSSPSYTSKPLANNGNGGLIGSFKSKNIGKSITSEINRASQSFKNINRSNSTMSAKQHPNELDSKNLSNTSDSPSIQNSSIDITNSYLHLTLKKSHNETFSDLKLFATSQSDLIAWLNAFQKPFIL